MPDRLNLHPCHQAALEYAERGWHVIPLHHMVDAVMCSCGRPYDPETHKDAAKHPYTKNGLKDATTNPEIINGWWRRWPDANVGIVCGSISGLVVLDVDSYKEGAARLEGLPLGMSVGQGVTARTGGGGLHIVYRHPGEGVRVKPRVGFLPGLDIRGDGSYIVAPPSNHASGNAYEWDWFGTPNNDELNDPAQLLRFLEELDRKKEEEARASVPPRASSPPSGNKVKHPERYIQTALERACREVASAAPGSRNATLNEQAFPLFRLVAGGSADASEVEQALTQAATSAGLDAHEIKTTLRSAKRAAEADPKMLDVAEDAPVWKGRPEEPPPPEAPPADLEGEPEAEEGEAKARKPKTPRWELVRQALATREGWRHEKVGGINLYQGQPITDSTLIQLRAELNAEGMDASISIIAEVASYLCAQHTTDALAEMLLGCKNAHPAPGCFDLDTALIRWTGAPDTTIVRAITRRWAISAVARAMQPGCKSDSVLVLVGGQGIGKSRLFRVLAGQENGVSLFSDNAADLSDKDSILTMHRHWLVEVAELRAFRRSDINTLRSFLSRQTDTVRRPYARLSEDLDRRFVLVGTSNEEAIQSDPEGVRRIWVVPVDRVDLDLVKQERLAFWAEAVHQFEAGETWWLDGLEEVVHEESQADFVETGSEVVEAIVRQFCHGKNQATIPRIVAFDERLKVGDRRTEVAIAQSLRKLGFKKSKGRSGIVWATSAVYFDPESNSWSSPRQDEQIDKRREQNGW